MSRALRIAGAVWLYGATALIFFGYACVWYFQGFNSLREMLSPFNVVGWGAVILALLPGALLQQWAEYLDRRAKN